MKTKTLLIAIMTFLIFLFAGCGISQAEYDSVSAQLRASRAQVAELQGEIKDLIMQRDAASAKLILAQTRVTVLEGLVSEIKQQYELVGETLTETAQNIVKRYHETHIYTEYDFFVCSDMALDVWDMLKAQGINALIQTGNVKVEAENITAADHAWVLAEISAGSYLALETTGGYSVGSKDNPLYYRGWSFDNPKEYKRFVELKQEYNILANVINGLTSEAQVAFAEYKNEEMQYQKLVDEFNMRYVGRPVSLEVFNFRDKIEAQLAITKEIEGRCNQLTDLIKEQTQKLENIISEMKGVLS